MILQIVSKSYDVDVQLLAQGDNVVVCLPIPSPSRLLELELSVSEYGTSFVDDLAEISASLGMTLKKEETWISTCLFEYSKSPPVWGAFVIRAKASEQNGKRDKHRTTNTCQ